MVKSLFLYLRYWCCFVSVVCFVRMSFLVVFFFPNSESASLPVLGGPVTPVIAPDGADDGERSHHP